MNQQNKWKSKFEFFPLLVLQREFPHLLILILRKCIYFSFIVSASNIKVTYELNWRISGETSERRRMSLLLCHSLLLFCINIGCSLIISPKEEDSIRNSMNAIALPTSSRRATPLSWGATLEKHLLPLGAFSFSRQTQSSHPPFILVSS